MVNPSDTLERFFAKVEIADCWEWTGANNGAQYGQFYDNGKMRYAHRWLYETLVEPIPTGMQLDHLCRNPPCVNPDHLQVVTARTNNLRSYSVTAQNARKGACPQGHEYNGTNLITSAGTRKCRACENARHRTGRPTGRTAKVSAADVADIRARYVKVWSPPQRDGRTSNAHVLAAEYGLCKAYVLAIVNGHDR